MVGILLHRWLINNLTNALTMPNYIFIIFQLVIKIGSYSTRLHLHHNGAAMLQTRAML